MILLEIDSLMASRDFRRLDDLGHLPDISNIRLDAVECSVEVRCKLCGQLFRFVNEDGVELTFCPSWRLRKDGAGNAVETPCSHERMGADR
jgi:hypothetical protein